MLAVVTVTAAVAAAGDERGTLYMGQEVVVVVALAVDDVENPKVVAD